MSDCLRLISGGRPDRAKERSGKPGGDQGRGECELRRHVVNERRAKRGEERECEMRIEARGETGENNPTAAER